MEVSKLLHWLQQNGSATACGRHDKCDLTDAFEFVTARPEVISSITCPECRSAAEAWLRVYREAVPGVKKPPPNYAFVDQTAKALEFYGSQEIVAKYLCRGCKQLRGIRPGRMPTRCRGCDSPDIDIETDLTSQRLEIERLGGIEAYNRFVDTGKMDD